MKKVDFLLLLVLSHLVGLGHCYGGIRFNPFKEFIHSQRSKHQHSANGVSNATVKNYSSLYKGPQDGLKAADKINALPGQPMGVEFDQYSGYVTVDPDAGRALFYYFVESWNSSGKPLVLWLNGGPGCSSLGAGALMELGPFRVNRDGTTLSVNEYAWTNVANIIFLESPAGVGFSYSNTTSDYDLSGDRRTALDTYSFLLNWLERFPEYKSRDFFITGESYAGHYVPQLARLILQLNEVTYDTIYLRGIAMGNPFIDSETQIRGEIDFYWSHALMSDEAHEAIISTCNFSSETLSETCEKYLAQVDLGNIDLYNIYGPLCNSTSSGAFTASEFDPCSSNYVSSYLNIPEVQKSLHANLTHLPGPWTQCSDNILEWNDSPSTVVPVIQELMARGISVWIYSGDIDGIVPVTTARYAIKYKLKTSVRTPWYPWSTQGEVGGFAVGYENLTFVTVRGSGHFVPSYQPARALTFFSSFLNGQLPPPSPY